MKAPLIALLCIVLTACGSGGSPSNRFADDFEESDYLGTAEEAEAEIRAEAEAELEAKEAEIEELQAALEDKESQIQDLESEIDEYRSDADAIAYSISESNINSFVAPPTPIHIEPVYVPPVEPVLIQPMVEPPVIEIDPFAHLTPVEIPCTPSLTELFAQPEC